MKREHMIIKSFIKNVSGKTFASVNDERIRILQSAEYIKCNVDVSESRFDQLSDKTKVAFEFYPDGACYCCLDTNNQKEVSISYTGQWIEYASKRDFDFNEAFPRDRGANRDDRII